MQDFLSMSIRARIETIFMLTVLFLLYMIAGMGIILEVSGS